MSTGKIKVMTCLVLAAFSIAIVGVAISAQPVPPVELSPVVGEQVEQKIPEERRTAVKTPLTILEPEIKPSNWYEEIGCLGYYPPERRLCAVILIKRQSFYGGHGEYVHFWVDWNNDGKFVASEDVGTYYVPVKDTASNHLPLEYCVCAEDITPLPAGTVPPGTVCKVRAQLGWQSPDNPTWGDIKESWIRIDPIE